MKTFSPTHSNLIGKRVSMKSDSASNFSVYFRHPSRKQLHNFLKKLKFPDGFSTYIDSSNITYSRSHSLFILKASFSCIESPNYSFLEDLNSQTESIPLLEVAGTFLDSYGQGSFTSPLFPKYHKLH